MKKIAILVGARPNFMKAAPIVRALRARTGQFQPFLIHSGQHYDWKMSEVFFRDLGLPKPNRHLGVGSGTQAEQTARVMVEFEKVLQELKPSLLIVVGDVNSTMAGALAAVKLGIRVAHVEAGLRSFNWSMPEEINRVVTDRVSDLLFTTEKSANRNLKNEGVPANRIFFAGNVMIDTLLRLLPRARRLAYYKKLGLKPGGYALVTLHRPSNVDNPGELKGIFSALLRISAEIPVVFPVHPRTAKRFEEFGLLKSREGKSNLVLTEPLGYLEFVSLMDKAKMVLTDSGGIQEETTILKVPCLTLRNETERPVTAEVGTNVMVGPDPAKIVAAAKKVLKGKVKKGKTPPLWDGKAAIRIMEVIKKAGRLESWKAGKREG